MIVKSYLISETQQNIQKPYIKGYTETLILFHQTTTFKQILFSEYHVQQSH